VKHETLFDPDAELIVVHATIRGPRGSILARMAIDTGSAATVLVPEVLDEIGYSARDGTTRTSVTTALGNEHGFLLRIAELEALGFTLSGFPVNVFELASRFGVEGLIGLNFLERFNYEVRSAEGRILVEKIAP
jgi:predicted aspartyl protease